MRALAHATLGVVMGSLGNALIVLYKTEPIPFIP